VGNRRGRVRLLASRLASRSACLLAVVVWYAGYAAGQGAIEAFSFDSPTQEQRYHALTEEFRCPKCLNTNLAGSDSPIAADLRATIHRLIIEGKSDDDIRNYLHDRYGDFVLYNPPLRKGTVTLWLAPALLLLIGLLAIVVLVRRRRGATATLTDDEQLRLAELLRDQPRADGSKDTL
jgi:cytochrome c-type biogenesis protein CcmH